MLRFLQRPPYYCCPNDHTRLLENRCPTCNRRFEVSEGILFLDAVQRSDRAAFDERNVTVEALNSEQKTAGIHKAGTMLAAAKAGGLHKLAVLDLGCGNGDLTFGLSQKLTNSDIYATDHSIDSLRVLLRSVPSSTNRLHVSTMDASDLCFPDASLDLVLGSAVLHHITDWQGVFKSVYRILKPEGTAVFTEPFWTGYFWVATLLAVAVENMGLTPEDLQDSKYGLAAFIVRDIAFRTKKRDNREALDNMTDKHLFQAESISALCNRLGFRSVSFLDYCPPEYYSGFMASFLDEYRIQEPILRGLAIRNYRVLAEMAGEKLAEIACHFKYIVVTKN
jgi:ubiquinone/menaquinone biosynthesis C-methylase UbiE